MSRRIVTVVIGVGAMAFALAGCFTNGTTATNTGVAGQPGAGLYRTLGDQGGACTVTRTDASNNAHEYSNRTGGPLYIRIKANDKSVTSKNCEPWLLAAFVAPIIEVPFRSGDYRVGYEIQPGKYQASGTGSDICKYGIVGDFKHDGSDGTLTPVAQPFGSPVTITISSGDFGFTSENCGNWVKQ